MRWFWIAALSLLGMSCSHPKPPIKRVAPPPPKLVTEIRAVWVSDTGRLDWNAATRQLQQAGFNTMYVNLASAGAAFYPGSKALPSVSSHADTLATGIAQAHQRGLTVHAKQVVMFSFKSPPDFQHKLLKADRVMRGADGKPIVQSGCYWVCPSQSPNREQAVAAVGEMLSRYPVDGIQFDYIRFNEEPSCYCKRCRQAYEQYAGKPVKRWPQDAGRFNEWRQNLITDWMRDLSTKARQTRPGIVVSAAVFPALDRAREEKAQDWKLWLERGYLDVICPMNYSPQLPDFEARCRGILANASRSRVVMGIGSWKLERPEALLGQIEATRRLGLGGFALFSYDDAAARNFLPGLR